MSETPSDDPQTGAWVTLDEAARLLRVTVRTVDRRGYAKRREPGRPVEVWIPTAVSDAVSDVTETPSDTVSDVSSRALALTVEHGVIRHVPPLASCLSIHDQLYPIWGLTAISILDYSGYGYRKSFSGIRTA